MWLLVAGPPSLGGVGLSQLPPIAGGLLWRGAGRRLFYVAAFLARSTCGPMMVMPSVAIYLLDGIIIYPSSLLFGELSR